MSLFGDPQVQTPSKVPLSPPFGDSQVGVPQIDLFRGPQAEDPSKPEIGRGVTRIDFGQRGKGRAPGQYARPGIKHSRLQRVGSDKAEMGSSHEPERLLACQKSEARQRSPPGSKGGPAEGAYFRLINYKWEKLLGHTVPKSHNTVIKFRPCKLAISGH